jgi:hypothetical protein
METSACHTAGIITLQDQKYLADVAIPIHCALPIDDNRVTKRSNEFHHYTIRPERDHRFAIERSHHPKRRAFTLVDVPVLLEKYRTAVQNDYEETGFFLDRVVIVKIVNDRLWRFSSADQPFKLTGFDKTSQQEVVLEPNTLAKSLSAHFGIDEDKIAQALAYKQVI